MFLGVAKRASDIKLVNYIAYIYFLILIAYSSLPHLASFSLRVSWGKKCSFFGKFGVLCFLETPILRSTLLSF